MELELSPRAAEIVAYTRVLLAARGYNGFSYADISDFVQISKASIHHHFPSKAELVQKVVALYREEARNGLITLEQHGAEPVDQLQAYIGYWQKCMRDAASSFCICAMLAAEMSAIPAEVADEVRRHFQDLEAWLATVLARGAAKRVFNLPAGPKAEAMALLATVHGAMLSARAYGDPKIFDKIVKANVGRLTQAA